MADVQPRQVPVPHFVQGWLKAGPTPRRNPSPREHAGDLRLGCWSGDDFVIVGARLVNAGPEGLMVIADTPIRIDQPVWVRLDGPERAETVRVTAHGTTALRHGRCAVQFTVDDAETEGFVRRAAARLQEDARVPAGPARLVGQPSWR